MNEFINMLDKIFLWISQNYRNELYMAGTRLAGLLCSYADIIMLWMFLKLCDDINGKISRRRYLLLKIFAVLTPSLLFVKDSTIFFILQGFVLSVPYFILVWTAFTEAKNILAHIKEVIHK